ncbi:MAG TPA: alpha/beta fold hydrolase [Candidatus Binatia bacterium]
MTYPIILAHGVCRFDILWNRALRVDDSDDPRIDSLHYFKGVRTMLKARGYTVCHSRVGWASDVDTRANDLKENLRQILDKTGAKKINIIAHSMGGLDARHMLFNDRNQGRIHECVASLVTISTPHEGTPFADWGLARFPSLPGIFRRIGLELHGLKDLRTDVCTRFNNDPVIKAFEMECESAIQFSTYAGTQTFWGVFSLLKGAFKIIQRKEGENDGLVSIRSARWRDRYFQETINETDHLNELGWWDPDQLFARESPHALRTRIHGLYARIASRLP